MHSRSGLITTVASQCAGQPARYSLEGSIAVAGSAVQWLRDNLGVIETASGIEPLAASVEDNGNVYFVPAFSGLFAPRWRPDARGVIVGSRASPIAATSPGLRWRRWRSRRGR